MTRPITPSQPSEAVERQDAPHVNHLPKLFFAAVFGALVTALLIAWVRDFDPLADVAYSLAVPMHFECGGNPLC